MSNCKSDLGVNHQIVNIKNEEEVKEALLSLLNSDNDLTENEEYFREDTLGLGYENEAQRIVDEYIKEKGIPNSPESFEEAANKISDSISDQEFYGECDLDVIDLQDGRVSMVFAYGG